MLGIYFCIGCILIIVYSCVYEDLPATEDLKINLRWVQSYPDETTEDVVIGLKWGLSFLGAELPKGSMDKVAIWISSSDLSLDLSAAGFNNEAEQSLMKIIRVLKTSEEYKLFNAIDVGRFIVLTLNSSYHYYAITGAKESLNSFRATYFFDNKQFAATSSSVAFGQRLIELPATDTSDKMAFIAHEGHGEIEEGTFQPAEFEVLSVMPNGQLRFALYDFEGKLKSSASPEFTTAGKPTKCLWCHEISLQVLHSVPIPVEGFYTPQEFVLKVQEFSAAIKNYRTTLNGEIDFNKTEEHTLLELLYIGFMEPSAFRLASEWDMSLSTVEQTLNQLPTHPHGEFPFFGDKLYRRSDIDTLAPYLPLQVPEDARELSSYEPDWIRL